MAFLPKSTSRDDYRKQRELDELRKKGQAAAEVDADGNVINPHIPDYIKNKPWYMGDTANSLKHQRKEGTNYDNIDTTHQRSTSSSAALKYRDGACTNCGAMTHKAKDCVERPRKKGAKFTGKDIAPDEESKQAKLDYEGSHDRWNGFQPEMFKKYMEEYSAEDSARKKKILDERAGMFMTEPDPANAKFPTEAIGAQIPESALIAAAAAAGPEDADAEEKMMASLALLAEKDPKKRTAMRNLRSREDRAKYLYNLELDSAHYDPKSRSMRENPNAGKNPDEYTFAGDNESLLTGDTEKYYELQKHAWESYGQVNAIAPSESEVLYEEFKRKKLQQESEKKRQLQSQYGGQEHDHAAPHLRLGQSEDYVEYTPEGIPLPRGNQIVKSKYAEDVLIRAHTSVFGSYYDVYSAKWGYKCCKQLLRPAYCTRADIPQLFEYKTQDVKMEDV